MVPARDAIQPAVHSPLKSRAFAVERGDERAHHQAPPDGESDGGHQERPAQRDREPPALGVLRDGVLPRARGGDQLGNQPQPERARGETFLFTRDRRVAFARLRDVRGRVAEDEAPTFVSVSRTDELLFLAARVVVRKTRRGVAADERRRERHERLGAAPALRSRGGENKSARGVGEVQERQPAKGRRDGDEFAPTADVQRLAERAFSAFAVCGARLALRAHPSLGVQRVRQQAARVQGPAGVLRGARRSLLLFARRRLLRFFVGGFGAEPGASRRRFGARVGKRQRGARRRRRFAVEAQRLSLRARRAPARTRSAVVLAVRQLQRRPRPHGVIRGRVGADARRVPSNRRRRALLARKRNRRDFPSGIRDFVVSRGGLVVLVVFCVVLVVLVVRPEPEPARHPGVPRVALAEPRGVEARRGQRRRAGVLVQPAGFVFLAREVRLHALLQRRHPLPALGDAAQTRHRQVAVPGDAPLTGRLDQRRLVRTRGVLPREQRAPREERVRRGDVRRSAQSGAKHRAGVHEPVAVPELGGAAEVLQS